MKILPNALFAFNNQGIMNLYFQIRAQLKLDFKVFDKI